MRLLKYIITAAAVIIAPAVIGGIALIAALTAPYGTRVRGEAPETAGAAKGAVYLPILMYHQILDNDSMLGKYVISPKEFEGDLKLLKKQGYTAITVSDLDDWLKLGAPLPGKPVMITFDDGFESDYAFAFPLLKKYAAKAVFSIIGSYTDTYSGDVAKSITYSHLNWVQVKEMAESGLCEFHNHSYSMHDMSTKLGALKKRGESESAYRERLFRDIDHIEGLFATEGIGSGVLCYTCPFGAVSSDLRAALKERGYEFVLTCTSGVNRITGDPEELYRLGRYIRPHNADMPSMLSNWETAIEKLAAKDALKPAGNTAAGED